MATPIPMPMRNERAAPTFDGSNAHELPWFFEDLESLIERANITSNKEMKKQVLKYVDIHTELMWKIFPEFSDDNKTYREFKDAILD